MLKKKMLNYNIHVNGTVEDKEKGFKCGIDISVSNGGSVENIGKAIQTALDAFHAGAIELPKENTTKNPE